MSKMHDCERCKHSFKTRTKLKLHKNRKTECTVPEFYCPKCKSGLKTKRCLAAHKRICKKKNDDEALQIEAKIQALKKKTAQFFEKLSPDFSQHLHELERLFLNTDVSNNVVVNKN